ncbi:MAG: hypothetical protein COY58_06560 [Gammaproteobacteria bacterium CG_4_10_14_0_8_um_filter_38_16]|nr:MAG: hypothetical protein COY58_06560 [Gammaproteobacteria bacterium CG_4_10_14_0_8_um_filter_38_16]PJA02652.1 MAG: hypothetical protein COX72_09400 [Gammaproteobacteria bacterium CG_4_10_14_0_2_um_filter_38_22]PJB11108.1 MAG: hypothetical protein CO120_01550 [Gammaproteobacteria bacterium CG_4_9_14_3_um_filter_38_9]
MCFSAPVSFTATAALSISGVAGSYFAIKKNKRFLVLNMMAFFYALQQFSEGMIWIGSPILSARFWGTLFLFFAFFVYPWFSGLSCYIISRQPHIKKKIAWIILAGLFFGTWCFSNVLLTPNLGLDLCRLHIFYNIHIMGGYHITGSVMKFILIPIYVFLTAAPFFICDKHYSSIIGWAIVLSSMVCWFVYFDYYISVWCFYAAIISCCITLMTFLI